MAIAELLRYRVLQCAEGVLVVWCGGSGGGGGGGGVVVYRVIGLVLPSLLGIVERACGSL